MHFYFLPTLAVVLSSLLATQHVSAAAVGEESACVKQAYKVYNTLTGRGCNAQDGSDSEDSCRGLFNLAINALNTDLEKCQRSDYATLCRVKPSGGFFSFVSCSTVTGGGRLTKAECETEASKDFTFQGASGSSTYYEAKNSKCINSMDYDCHNLCR